MNYFEKHFSFLSNNVRNFRYITFALILFQQNFPYRKYCGIKFIFLGKSRSLLFRENWIQIYSGENRNTDVVRNLIIYVRDNKTK